MDDTYFMDIAQRTAAESKCSRRKVGAVLVRNKRLVAHGYNGTLAGMPNCNQGGCPRCSGTYPPGVGYHLCTCLHAELNCILNAASEGIQVGGCELFTTLQPCIQCLMTAFQGKIIRIVYAERLLMEAEVESPYADIQHAMFLRNWRIEKYVAH